MTSDLAASIRSVRFSPVRLKEGYDMGEVDYLLDRLLAAVEKGEPVAPILDGVELSEVRLREGYDIEEVDTFLAQVREQALAPAAPEETVPEPDASAPVPAPTPAPSVIVEQRGFLARIFRRR